MAIEVRKFLDEQGVTTLWGKIATKIATDIKVEADRAAAAEKVLSDNLDSLSSRVGNLPEGTTATSVVEYINAKTANIASSETVANLSTRVEQAEKDIDAIEADYLTSTDYNALAQLVANEASRADTAEKANAAAIKAVADDYLKGADKTALEGSIGAVEDKVDGVIADYLKAADKTALENAIALKADASALAQEVTDRTNAVAGLQTQIDTILNNPDTEGVINSINEFTQYIADHGEIAEGFRTDIDQNKADIAAEVLRATGAESGLAERIEALENGDYDYGTADSALKSELMAEINKKADKTEMETALAGKASTGDLAAVSAVANAAATKTYVDEELAKKADKTALEAVSAVANAAAVKSEVNAALALKADQSALEAEVTARQNAVKANSDAISAIRDHATVDSFADVMLEIAKKQDTIPANTYDVHGAAAQALSDAKSYTDTEIAKIQALSTVDIENAIAAASV